MLNMQNYMLTSITNFFRRHNQSRDSEPIRKSSLKRGCKKGLVLSYFFRKPAANLNCIAIRFYLRIAFR